MQKTIRLGKFTITAMTNYNEKIHGDMTIFEHIRFGRFIITIFEV